jgi:hypothetical protein
MWWWNSPDHCSNPSARSQTQGSVRKCCCSPDSGPCRTQPWTSEGLHHRQHSCNQPCMKSITRFINNGSQPKLQHQGSQFGTKIRPWGPKESRQRRLMWIWIAGTAIDSHIPPLWHPSSETCAADGGKLFLRSSGRPTRTSRLLPSRVLWLMSSDCWSSPNPTDEGIQIRLPKPSPSPPQVPSANPHLCHGGRRLAYGYRSQTTCK